jgi:hypothetical protein
MHDTGVEDGTQIWAACTQEESESRSVRGTFIARRFT